MLISSINFLPNLDSLAYPTTKLLILNLISDLVKLRSWTKYAFRLFFAE